MRDNPPPDSNGLGRVLSALDGWSVVSRGKPIMAHRGEHDPVRVAVAAWEQVCITDDGKPVPWADAVERCVKAAMGRGTKFGDRPGYAITVIGGMLGEWEKKGIRPEREDTGVRSTPVDDGAAERGFEDAMRRIEARQKARSA